jgi:hypothetical protein
MTMPQKLVISSIATGFETDKPAFLFNNDAFTELVNAYCYRKRLLKKRGTLTLGRLRRDLADQALGNTNGSGIYTGNIISVLTLGADATIVPGSLEVTVGAQVFVEPPTPDGTLSNGGAGTGTINYATGALVIHTNPILVTTAVTIDFGYYPALPGMGVEEYTVSETAAAPINVADVVFFDTRYAYQFDFALRHFYDVSFYKMPAPQNRIVWHGADYQQFWSWSYQGALFVTNNVPGFHFKPVTAITVAAQAQITIVAHGLQVNSKIWLNEVAGMVEINGLTGTVLAIVDADNVTVDIDSSGFTAYTSGGIAQYLTDSLAGQDGIRWYDGFGVDRGFVNFMPALQQFDVSLLPNPAYLVGARMIIPYQNQLLAIGTFESTSNGTVRYFPNRFRYSQRGTVYYSSLTPAGYTFEPDAWIDNINGKGGFVDLDTTEKILSASVSQEVLIMGLEATQRKVTGTSNPLDPFTIQTINPEYGTESTYATIALDKGVLSVGDYGFVLASSYSAQRFDLQIPDQVYQIKNVDNGNERVCGIRDFRNEFVYFTYTVANSPYDFPNRTLLYNLRENSFAIFKEEFTSYGQFRDATTQSWTTSTRPWREYAQSWNSFRQYARFPQIAGLNQQGFCQLKDQGTANDASHYIRALSGTSVTSPNHNREVGDYIYIQDCIGSTNLNDTVVQVVGLTSADIFVIDQAATGTYLGLGQFSVVDNFSVKTKVFPFDWPEGLGTRIGTQQYLLQTTSGGEITVDLYLNQNSDDPANDLSVATYLPVTSVVRTRPDESLGLHDAQLSQAQIWHRMSQSFSGDSIQLGMRFSDTQMRSYSIATSDVAVYAIVIDYYPSRILA